MSADDYRQGVSGAGSAWKEEVDTDESEQNYQNGATEDAASEYQSNASAAGDSYAAGIASYLGVNEDQVTTGSAYTQGVGEAGAAWREGVGRSGGKWRRGVSRASAQDYEDAAEAAAEDWMEGYRQGVTQD